MCRPVKATWASGQCVAIAGPDIPRRSKTVMQEEKTWAPENAAKKTLQSYWNNHIGKARNGMTLNVNLLGTRKIRSDEKWERSRIVCINNSYDRNYPERKRWQKETNAMQIKAGNGLGVEGIEGLSLGISLLLNDRVVQNSIAKNCNPSIYLLMIL